MKQSVAVLMELLKSEVTGTKFEISRFTDLTGEEQMELVSLAAEHALAQLVGDVLGKNQVTRDLPFTRKMVSQTMLTVMNISRMEGERQAICQLFDREGIPYIQLKGARLRPCYPEPWMRSSCDIDILVHEEDLERACACLTGALSYEQGGRNYHDVPFNTPSGIHLELHFSIKEHARLMDDVLEQVWEYSFPADSQDSFEYVQTGEFFLFHLIAHTAYHLARGGCGIRPFLDLFLLQKSLLYDETQVLELCRRAGVEQFYENEKRLVQVWFYGAPHDDVTRRLEHFVLYGGTYGNQESRVAAAQSRQGSKLGYLRSRIFMSTEDLCTRYPELKAHRWLAPVYQVRRWGGALFGGDTGRFRREIRVNQEVDEAFTDEIQQMLKENGLYRM